MARGTTIISDRPTSKRVGALRALWPFLRPYRVQVGLAPLEDFAYPLAGVLLLPGLWLLLGGRVASARAPGGTLGEREPGARTGGRTALDNPRETRD